MTTTLFAYPDNAEFGSVVPKTKIYDHVRPTSAVREMFVRQVEQIIWQYKLAPETINIKATVSVTEIQIFRILLRERDLKPEVLRCIDQAIPFPIIYELRFENRVKPIAAYKRPSETDATKWLIGAYFDGGWVSDKKSRTPLPFVFDLETLYDQLLNVLIPWPARPAEGLQTRMERMELIQLKQRELNRCEVRLRKEKQFNLKVAINSELRELKHQLGTLTR